MKFLSIFCLSVLCIFAIEQVYAANIIVYNTKQGGVRVNNVTGNVSAGTITKNCNGKTIYGRVLNTLRASGAYNVVMSSGNCKIRIVRQSAALPIVHHLGGCEQIVPHSPGRIQPRDRSAYSFAPYPSSKININNCR